MFLLVARLGGRTISVFSLCYWVTRNWLCGAPVSFYLSGFFIVFTVLLCSQSWILFWLNDFVALTAAWSIWVVPNAFAASSGGSPPKRRLYSATKVLFCGVSAFELQLIA